MLTLRRRRAELGALELPDGVWAVRLMLVCAPGLISWLISREGLPWGGFSHAMSLLRDGTVIDSRSDRQPCVDGVRRRGVQHRPAGYIRWKRIIVLEWRVTREVYEAWSMWLSRQIGKGYDTWAIWGFIFGSKDHLRRHWICSALCTGGMKWIGIFRHAHVSILADEDVSPSTLAAVGTLGAGGQVVFRFGLR